MSSKPYLNLGCGKIILPGAGKPAHHALIPEEVYSPDRQWVNVDRIAGEGVTVADVFSYPWAWEDNSFDGALITHLVEHIPHEVDLDWRFPDNESLPYSDPACERLQHLSDGFYAFFAELHRVLTPGAVAHVLVPYAFSSGAMQDPTHRRYVTPETFSYLVPNPDAPFVLEGIGAWTMGNVMFGLTQMGHELQQVAMQEARQQAATLPAGGGGLLRVQEQPSEALIAQIAGERFSRLLMTRINVADDLYVPLTVVK